MVKPAMRKSFNSCSGRRSGERTSFLFGGICFRCQWPIPVDKIPTAEFRPRLRESRRYLHIYKHNSEVIYSNEGLRSVGSRSKGGGIYLNVFRLLAPYYALCQRMHGRKYRMATHLAMHSRRQYRPTDSTNLEEP
jgi:hypothetical protein